MNISEFCIQRPVFTILLMAAILVGGLAGYSTLSVSALPDVDFPTIQITAELPGASPATMAATVALPLEQQLSTIAGVSTMTSTSYLGITQITLQFDLSRNLDGAALDVQTAISAALTYLPRQMPSQPTFQKINPADQPILFIAASSDSIPLSQVEYYVDTLLSQRISTLNGVAQVSIYGMQKYAVRVRADPTALAARNLSFADLATALGAATSITPPGVISGTEQLLNLEIVDQPQSAQAFKKLTIAWNNGAPVRLSDVARVDDGVEDERTISYLNGKQAIVLAIQRQPDANTVDVVASVLKLLPVFKQQLPEAVALTPIFDRAVSVKASIHDVQFTLQLAIVLVILVIFLFLRKISATIIPSVSVPLSIIAAYGGMALCGFSLNNISLLALTLCVGFVVDDAIVMLENIVRHVEQGLPVREAALKGSRQIGFTIISMTFSLVAVFIPVLFMGGIIGRLFREFAVTISLAILISGIIALTLTPMMCSLMLKKHAKNAPENTNWFTGKAEYYFNKLLTLYDNTLQTVLRHKFTMLIITMVTIVITLILYIVIPKGFFPLEDTGFIFAQTEAAQDISYEAMLKKQDSVTQIICHHPAVLQCFSGLGGARGPLNTGRVFFGLKPRNQRGSMDSIMQQLRVQLANLEGIEVFMQPVQNISIGGKLTTALYQYTLQGSDLETLSTYSDQLSTAIANIHGVTDVYSDLQLKSLQVSIKVDEDKAGSFGITYDNIRSALYNAFGVAEVGQLYTANDTYQVILEIDPRYQLTLDDIKTIYVKSSTGQLVKLDTFTTITRTHAPLSVNHQGQLPAATISFNLLPGTAIGDVVTTINKLTHAMKLPSSIIPSFQGTAQAFTSSLSNMLFLLLLAIIVIYIILGMLYESFIHPITILAGLPAAGIGALIALMIFGMPLDVLGIIGILLLIGIIKKNAIMMIDFAVRAQQQDITAEQAIYQACLTRFRPIMMTTMAALLGTLPIALGIGAGSELRQPFGIAVVGGLLTSQLLTLYITPVIYIYFDRLAAKLQRKLHPAE